MSLSRFLTESEVRANFDKCIKDATELGLWPPSDQGFDDYVNEALRQVAKSYPNVRGDLITNAKLAIEGQFDGTNAARREAELAAWLAQHAT